MLEKEKFVVYKGRVCEIKGRKEKHINNTDYFILHPLDDKSLTINIPTTTKAIRKLLQKKEVEELINRIPEIPILDSDERNMEREYRKLLESEEHENLIKIIKTTYLRNKQRLDAQKKQSDIDDVFFKKAERLLYNEFSIVLKKSYNETKKYVIDKVNDYEKRKK